LQRTARATRNDRSQRATIDRNAQRSIATRNDRSQRATIDRSATIDRLQCRAREATRRKRATLGASVRPGRGALVACDALPRDALPRDALPRSE
jgi:hypothetical protein